MKTPKWFLSKSFLAYVLLPVSAIYIFVHYVVFISRLITRKNNKSLKTPVICVGGILAGGVGKTPIVRALAERFNAPVIMRGYKSKQKNVGYRAQSIDTSFDIGDEAKMLSDSGLSVWVGDRLSSISKINAAPILPDAIIMDDGFQNPTIKKDISILVFDENIGIGNGYCIPAGPLREPLGSGVARCDAVIVVRDSGAMPRPIGQLRNRRRPIFIAEREPINPGLNGKVVAFAGIGYPKKFFNTVQTLPKVRLIESVSFPDHHDYSKEELIKLFQIAKSHEAQLVCTEKDWVKLPKQIRKKIKFLPIEIHLKNEFWNWLNITLSKAKGEKDENICE